MQKHLNAIRTVALICFAGKAVSVSFTGCVRYALALDEPGKEARLLYSEGLLTETPQDIIDGFECQRHLNSRVRHWCGHISLSYSPKDKDRMTDEFMVKLALEYMEKMGIKNTQFIITIQHTSLSPSQKHTTTIPISSNPPTSPASASTNPSPYPHPNLPTKSLCLAKNNRL